MRKILKDMMTLFEKNGDIFDISSTWSFSRSVTITTL